MGETDLPAKLLLRLKRVIVPKGEYIEGEFTDAVLNLPLVLDEGRQLGDPPALVFANEFNIDRKLNQRPVLALPNETRLELA